MTNSKTTLKVYTAAGVNPSEFADSLCNADNGISWRNAVANANSDGTGIVFMECDTDSLDWLTEQLQETTECESYSKQ